MLETAPSLSIYAQKSEEQIEISGDNDKIDGGVSSDFSFSKPSMDLIDEELGDDDDGLGRVIAGIDKIRTEEKEEEEDAKIEHEIEIEPPSPPMYLAAGLGVGGKEDFRVDDEEYSEEYYRELLEEYPNHPLLLRNYGKLLQRKGDLQGAEYYYFCATQADPGDGETLSLYAQLLWELHRDRDKALAYFESAVHAAPQDSNVMAAYAKFLWEIEDDRDNESTQPNHLQEETRKSARSASHPTDGAVNGEPKDISDPEEYCKRMIEENPSDPVFMKTYAQFLYQSKGDLKGAEEYYLQAIEADPQDGKVLAQYAKLIWEFYHDEDRAARYFEKAIQAAPADSDVLAAYASFLWTIDDDEVEQKLDSFSEKVLAACTDV